MLSYTNRPQGERKVVVVMILCQQGLVYNFLEVKKHLSSFEGKVESFFSGQKSNNFKVDVTPLSSVFL